MNKPTKQPDLKLETSVPPGQYPVLDRPTADDEAEALFDYLLEKLYDDQFMLTFRDVAALVAEEASNEEGTDQHLVREMLRLSDQLSIVHALMFRNSAYNSDKGEGQDD